NDAMTAILGALLPTLQVRFDAGPTALALMIAVFWIASSVAQPVFGALGEDVGLRLIGCVGVLMASTFLSLIGVASELWLVFVLLVLGGPGARGSPPRRDDHRQLTGDERNPRDRSLHRRGHGGLRARACRHPARRLHIRHRGNGLAGGAAALPRRRC